MTRCFGYNHFIRLNQMIFCMISSIMWFYKKNSSAHQSIHSCTVYFYFGEESLISLIFSPFVGDEMSMIFCLFLVGEISTIFDLFCVDEISVILDLCWVDEISVISPFLPKEKAFLRFSLFWESVRPTFTSIKLAKRINLIGRQDRILKRRHEKIFMWKVFKI